MSALIVRYLDRDGATRVGVLENNVVHECAGESIASLVCASKAARRTLMSLALDHGARTDVESVRLLAPIDGRMEVWASGVTYVRSRDARMQESQRDADIYERVYDATRPELFFKSTAWRVVGPEGTVTIRRDATVTVPEPELAVVIDPRGRIVGLSIGNDMSSRDIEGANPLYLPQAKIWMGACALGPGIVLLDDIVDPYDLHIAMTIRRAGDIVFEGQTSTAQLHRRLDELAPWPLREDEHPDGLVLCTGTGIVPELTFTLQPADRIEISIDGIGMLANTVGWGKDECIP